MALFYVAISLLSMLFPPANKPDMLRYVSWNEFYHQMLAKGEVELIVVKPELDLVTVYLYEGAVIKGKRAPYRSYHLNIANVPTFEQKLRDAEASLGIKPDQSVQIVYERNPENAWFGVLLVLGGFILIMSLLGTSLKMGPTVNMFVSLILLLFP